jgi:putative membrane protein
VPGITFAGSWVRLLVAGAIFGLLNLIVRPIALLLSLPALVLTLGLFYFVLNGLLLWAFSQFMPGYTVNGLWAGILGSLVIMGVNWVASALFGGHKK